MEEPGRTRTPGGEDDVEPVKQLTAMGEGVINLVKTRNLNCIPQDLNGDGRVEMNVLLSGGASIPPFTVTGQTIQFDSYLPAGSHELQYYCLKN